MTDNNFSQPPLPEVSVPVTSGKPRLVLAVFLAVVLILLVAAFAVAYPTISKKYKLQSEIKILSEKLSKSSDNQSFIEIYRRALLDVPKGPDAKAQYKKVFNLIQGIEAEYGKSHDPRLRELIGSIKDFSQKNLPDYYQDEDFFVLCLDTQCAKLEYKPEILEIKNEAEKVDLGLNKEALLNALYNASLSSEGTTDAERDREWDNLAFVLDILHKEAQTGSIQAKDLETKLLDYLQKSYPNFVNPWESTTSAR